MARNADVAQLRGALALQDAAIACMRESRDLVARVLHSLDHHQSTRAVLSIQGADMGLTVDTTTGNAVLTFEDDHGDVAAPPNGDGSGLVVAFTASAVDSTGNPAADPTVGTASAVTDAEGNVTYEASIGAPLTEGTITVGASVANASGAELFDDDGVTPFTQPESVSQPVSAGQAVSGSLAVTE